MPKHSTTSARRSLSLLATVTVLAVTLLASSPAEVGAQEAGCPGVGDNFADPGPSETTIQEDAEHTYHSPTDLGSNGCTQHPVIVWGNGTWTDPSVYEPLLSHLASHGFIVAAANTSNAGSGNEMRAGLDNLTTFNETSDNRFFEKVDLDRVGATGHSQGGGGAIEATKDERIGTMAPMAPFVGNQTGLQPDDTAVFFAGTLDDWIPPDTVKARYEGVTMPAAYAELADANHFIPAATAGDFRAPLTAWMRWQLMDDTTARDVFIGDDCGLCTDPLWTDYEANEALQALGTSDPVADPTTTTTTPDPGGEEPPPSEGGQEECSFLASLFGLCDSASTASSGGTEDCGFLASLFGFC